jgi:hypothetical protein
MASLRKVNKTRWMSVKKMLKEIDKRGMRFSYKYGSGYFVFSFDADEYNLHIFFNDLPDIRFGIWKTKCYGNDEYYFFAEHDAYVDKFKPSAVAFTFADLDNMIAWAKDIASSSQRYKEVIETEYFKPDDKFKTFEEEVKWLKEWHKYNHMERDEYLTSLNKFNGIIASLDTNKWDFFWKRSDCTRTLYDLYYYVDSSVTDEEHDAMEKALTECNVSIMPYGLHPHYWRNRKAYQVKYHPRNKKLYTNYTYWKKYYRK